MQFSQIFTTTNPRLKRYFPAIVLGCIGLVVIGYGLITSLVSSQPQDEIVFESKSEGNGSAVVKSSEVTIDVSGAVEKPGVYNLPKDARVHDALVTAGGLSGDADRLWVAKHLNLAAKLTDGAKVYIPITGEQPLQGGVIGSNTSGVVGAQTQWQINVNTASEQELDTLSGVGMVTADKIVKGRPYQRIEELIERKILGQSTFDKIKDKITTN